MAATPSSCARNKKYFRHGGLKKPFTRKPGGFFPGSHAMARIPAGVSPNPCPIRSRARPKSKSKRKKKPAWETRKTVLSCGFCIWYAKSTAQNSQIQWNFSIFPLPPFHIIKQINGYILLQNKYKGAINAKQYRNNHSAYHILLVCIAFMLCYQTEHNRGNRDWHYRIE